MKRYKLALLAACVASVAVAQPTVQVSPGVKGGISKTIIETWPLTDAEKKNHVMMMSQISARAIAPTTRIRKGEWEILQSEHQACFYNTFGTTVEGRYVIKFNIGGGEVSAFDKVPVGGGQAFCVTRFLQMAVRGERPGNTPSVASTHVEMDGNSTDNEGHGTITVR
jgi:hypothetical protein